jgi:hypothetical protein
VRTKREPCDAVFDAEMLALSSAQADTHSPSNTPKNRM